MDSKQRSEEVSVSASRDVEYQPNCHRIERDGEVVARYITTNYGEIKWSVIYANVGTDATGRMIRATLTRTTENPDDISMAVGGNAPDPWTQTP